MKEKWKPVVGTQGLYKVSNMGRVKSLQKVGRPARGGIIRLQPNKKGYLRAGLSIGGRRFTKVVQRLVLEAFVGPQPSVIHESNHIDGVKSNNRLKNLEWATPVENNAHSVANGLWHPHIGEAHGRAKLKEKDVSAIRSLEGKVSSDYLAERHKVSSTAIRLIWRRINWKHVT